MFKGLVLAKFFLAHFANVYNIVRKMKSKEYKENQSRFSFNKKKKKETSLRMKIWNYHFKT